MYQLLFDVSWCQLVSDRILKDRARLNRQKVC